MTEGTDSIIARLDRRLMSISPYLSFWTVQCQPNLATVRSWRKTAADSLLDAAEDSQRATAAGGATGRRLLRAGPPQILPKRRQILQLKRKRSALSHLARSLPASVWLRIRPSFRRHLWLWQCQLHAVHFKNA